MQICILITCMCILIFLVEYLTLEDSEHPQHFSELTDFFKKFYLFYCGAGYLSCCAYGREDNLWELFFLFLPRGSRDHLMIQNKTGHLHRSFQVFKSNGILVTHR